MPKHVETRSELAIAVSAKDKKADSKRRKIASKYISAVTDSDGDRKGVIHAYRNADIKNRDRARIGVKLLSFPIDPITDRVAEWTFRTGAEAFLDNDGRVADRIKRTKKAKKVKKDINTMLDRGEVNILDTDSYIPRIEEAMTIMATLSDVKSLISAIPIGGPAINFLLSEAQTLIKLGTADSNSAKATSFLAAQIIATINGSEAVAGLAELPAIALGGSGFLAEAATGAAQSYINTLFDLSRVERGLDTGDQVADYGSMLAYQAIVKDGTISAEIKKNIARAIVERYDQAPKKWKVERHKRAKRKIERLKKNKEKASKVSRGVKVLRRFSTLKGMKTFMTVEKIISSRVANAENYPQSISQKVEYVLANAGDIITSMGDIIVAPDASKEEVKQAKIQKAYWEFRLSYAQDLKALYEGSKEVLNEKELEKITAARDAGYRRIHRIARPAETAVVPQS